MCRLAVVRGPARSALAALLVGAFLMPLSHPIWGADAPGRSIRTLGAFAASKPRETLHARATRRTAFLVVVDESQSESRVVFEKSETEVEIDSPEESTLASLPDQSLSPFVAAPLHAARSSRPSLPLRC